MAEPTPHTPQPPTSLPHIYVDEKKRSIKQWVLIAFLSITVLSIPIGVYLVSQPTNITPQAAIPQTSPGEVLMFLDTPKVNVSDGEEFQVNIKVKSDLDPSNLFVSELKFNPKNFEVLRIATDSASVPQRNGTYFATSWLDLDFDNTNGTVSVAGGVPNPGLKTEIKSPPQDYILATVFFRSINSTQDTISLDQKSAIYRNSDNQNVLQTTKDLKINVTFSSSSTPIPKPIIKPTLSQSTPSGFLLSPKGGEVYSYYKSIPIEWNTLNIRSIKEVNLYLNDKFFGTLGQNLDNTGRVLWQPNSTLLLPLINNQSTFKVEIKALTRAGQTIVDKSSGPFGLIPRADFDPISTPSAAVTDIKGSIGIHYASKIYSNFGLTKLIHPEADLNKDGIANELDIYLLRGLLITQGLL